MAFCGPTNFKTLHSWLKSEVRKLFGITFLILGSLGIFEKLYNVLLFITVASYYLCCTCLLLAQLVNHLPVMQETWVWSLGLEDILEKRKATHSSILGFPSWLRGKRIHLPSRRCGFDSWVLEDPLENWQPTPVFLRGKSQGQRSLVGNSPWGWKRVGHNLSTK